MEDRIDAVIKSLLDRIGISADAVDALDYAEAISKLADAKQILFCIGETKNQKTA